MGSFKFTYLFLCVKFKINIRSSDIYSNVYELRNTYASLRRTKLLSDKILVFKGISRCRTLTIDVTVINNVKIIRISSLCCVPIVLSVGRSSDFNVFLLNNITKSF